MRDRETGDQILIKLLLNLNKEPFRRHSWLDKQ